MAIEIVGITSSQSTGAINVSVTPHVDAAEGDTLFFCIAAHRQPLSSFTMTPPFSTNRMVGFPATNSGAPIIYAIPYAGAISYTFTFSVSTIYADVACVVVRGHRTRPYTHSPSGTDINPIPIWRSGETQGGGSLTGYSAIISMGDVSTSTDNNLFLCFGRFSSAAASVYSLPAEFTVVWNAVNSSASWSHTAFIATCEFPTAGNYHFSDGTLTGSVSYIFDWCVLVPDDVEEPYSNEWTLVTTGSSTVPAVVVDTIGPYIYQIGVINSDDMQVRQIHRGTLEITDVTIADAAPRTINVAAVQDDTSIFVAADTSPGNTVVRIQKSDLTLMTTYSSTLNPIFLTYIALGQGWNSGKVWALWDRQLSGGNLISWDIETGTEVDNISLGTLMDGPSHLLILPSGDILVAGEGASSSYFRIIKVPSSLIASTLVVFNGAQGEQPIIEIPHAMLYDSEDGNILIIPQTDDSNDPDPIGYRHLMKINPSGTILEDVRRLPETTTNVDNESGVIRSFEGRRSLFVGEMEWNEPGRLLIDGSIIQLDPTDLSHIQTFRLPLDRFRAYNIRCDPEGKIWVVTSPSTHMTTFDLYVLGFESGGSSIDEKIWGRGVFGYGYARGYA